MNPIPTIIDSDAGIDDAIAIMLAAKLPQLKLVGVTSVAGNVGVDKTTHNCLRVLEFTGMDVPVYRGSAGPMFRQRVDAAFVHGADGLGGMDLPCHTHEVEGIKAWDYIYSEAVRWNGELQLIAIGPLTNLGMAFVKYPGLPKLLKRIVIMGGSASEGNDTPAAEFNIWADPEAADIVFCSGVPVHMCGLDVTMQAHLTPGEIDEIGRIGNPQSNFFRDVVQGILNFLSQFNFPGMHMHDPVAVLYAADDSMFEASPVGVRVETKGALTLGRTVTDLYSDAQWEKNAFIVTKIDRDAFVKKVFELMSKY